MMGKERVGEPRDPGNKYFKNKKIQQMQKHQLDI